MIALFTVAHIGHKKKISIENVKSFQINNGFLLQKSELFNL